MFWAKSKALQDSYIHCLAKRLDEYGDDGVYLDGSAAFVPCQNMLHGCPVTQTAPFRAKGTPECRGAIDRRTNPADSKPFPCFTMLIP